MAEKRDETSTSSASGCPTSRASTCSRTRDGEVIYVGKATSRSASASPRHFSGPHRGGLEFIEQVASIDFLVTETEAEALLAEQQFIKRHRPRFNIRLRDDKSYPYIGISLDEEFPRVYFTRERHRSGRVYFGPFSSAKRVRETLDLLGKLFQYRTCEGPEPGRRSGVPCLDYYIKRCAGALRRLHRPRGVPAQHRRDRRLPLRPLPRRRARPGAQDGRGGRRRGVRARRRLPRPARGGALADGAPQRRRRVARDAPTWSRSRSRAPRPTRRSSRSATACSPSATASTSPTRASATRTR